MARRPTAKTPPPRPARALHGFAVSIAAAAAAMGCEGHETARPDWIALPVTLGSNEAVQLIGVDSGLCVEIGGGGYSDRDPVQLAECAVSSRQQFRLTYKTGGQFQVTSAASNKCLDVDSASTKPMAHVFQWLCGDGPNQQFLIANRGSLAQLQARHSGMCLDVQSGGHEPGTPLIQWPCSSGANQQFWIVPVDRGGRPPG